MTSDTSSKRPRRVASEVASKRLKVAMEQELSASQPSYFDAAPTNSFEREIHALNCNSFPEAQYSRLDDIAVIALFANLDNSRRRGLLPDKTSALSLSLTAARSLKRLVAEVPERLTPKEKAHLLAQRIAQTLPDLSSVQDIPCLTHLLHRYYLMLDTKSAVMLQKVTYDGHKSIQGGVKALSYIPAFKCILELCGSLSADEVPGGHHLSAIEASPSHHNINGIRLILGPFRFVNHDCNPNCQIRPIRKSYAYGMVTLRDIQAGESILVSYSKDGYFGYGGGQCRCETCNPGESVVSLPKEMVYLPSTKKPGHKTRRGKRKSRTQRLADRAMANGDHLTV